MNNENQEVYIAVDLQSDQTESLIFVSHDSHLIEFRKFVRLDLFFF